MCYHWECTSIFRPLSYPFRSMTYSLISKIFKQYCHKKDNYYETNIFVSGPTPYVAGYGNRPNDIEAYQKVGIPR